MTPETLPSILPYAIGAITSVVVLGAFGMHSARSRRLFVPVIPVLVVAGFFVYGFFRTADKVRQCSDCASTFAVAGLDIVGTERVGTSFGGLLYADLLVLLGLAVLAGLALAARPFLVPGRS